MTDKRPAADAKSLTDGDSWRHQDLNYWNKEQKKRDRRDISWWCKPIVDLKLGDLNRFPLYFYNQYKG